MKRLNLFLGLIILCTVVFAEEYKAKRCTTWASDVYPLLSSKGSLGHGGTRNSGGLSFGNDATTLYNNIVNVHTATANMFYVSPGSKENSYFYLKLANTVPPYGSRMPLSGGYFTADQLQLVGDWIDGGASLGACFETNVTMPTTSSTSTSSSTTSTSTTGTSSSTSSSVTTSSSSASTSIATSTSSSTSSTMGTSSSTTMDANSTTITTGSQSTTSIVNETITTGISSTTENGNVTSGAGSDVDKNPSQQQQKRSANSDNTGVIVGAVLGSAVGVVIIITTVVVLYKRRQQLNKPKENVELSVK